MKIVFVGMFALGTVNGTYNAIWSAARSLVTLDHEVTIIALGHESTDRDVEIAQREGVTLLRFSSCRWFGFWKDTDGVFEQHIRAVKPDIVDLQFVRIPKYVFISNFLRREGIPYVITLHGGMNSTEMKRKYWRKLIYWHLVDKHIHGAAAARLFVSLAEQADYYHSLGTPKKADAVIPVSVVLPNGVPKWKGRVDVAAPTLSYFGRYDIWTKGLDKAALMIEALHVEGIKAELHLYGSPGDRFEQDMREYMSRHAETPIVDHGFVDGLEKFSEMARHDFFLLYSRFEAVGISLIEAMSCGVPAIVSELCDISSELAAQDAAIVIPMDPAAAAKVIVEALGSPSRIQQIAENGRVYASRKCDPVAITQQTSSFYQQACRL